MKTTEKLSLTDFIVLSSILPDTYLTSRDRLVKADNVKFLNTLISLHLETRSERAKNWQYLS